MHFLSLARLSPRSFPQASDVVVSLFSSVLPQYSFIMSAVSLPCKVGNSYMIIIMYRTSFGSLMYPVVLLLC